MKILTSIFTIFLFATTSWATDLSTATLKQLVTERPDLVRAIKAGKNEGTSTVSVIKDAHGRMNIWAKETRDIDDALIGKRIDKYSYYQTGEINEIIQEVYDSEKLIKKTRLKHYRDGTQPDVEGMTIDAKIPKK